LHLLLLRRSSSFLFFLLAITGGSMLAFAQGDIRKVADAVDHRYNGLHSMQAQFTEHYTGAGMERTESGLLSLKKPGKMRWEYQSPRAKVFVSDGKLAWFYVPGENQARQTQVKKLDDLRTPLRYLLGHTKLEKEFTGLSLAPDVKPLHSGDTMLRGVPASMADRVSQVLLEISPENRIARLVVDELDGSRTEFEFTAEQDDPVLPDAHFAFKPPEGVEILQGSELTAP
jgi:outer membrane lipoprotein carrier protein